GSRTFAIDSACDLESRPGIASFSRLELCVRACVSDASQCQADDVSPGLTFCADEFGYVNVDPLRRACFDSQRPEYFSESRPRVPSQGTLVPRRVVHY